MLQICCIAADALSAAVPLRRHWTRVTTRHYTRAVICYVTAAGAVCPHRIKLQGFSHSQLSLQETHLACPCSLVRLCWSRCSCGGSRSSKRASAEPVKKRQGDKTLLTSERNSAVSLTAARLPPALCLSSLARTVVCEHMFLIARLRVCCSMIVTCQRPSRPRMSAALLQSFACPLFCT